MGLPQGMSGEEDLERVWRVKSGEWRQEVALVRLIVLLLTKKTCHCEPVRFPGVAIRTPFRSRYIIGT